MRRSSTVSLIMIVVIAAVGLAATAVAGNRPELGLDLQGGASVVLRPENDVETGVLDQSIEIIRARVDALGVAEPDISRQGDSIVVQLPGVKDQARALEIVGQTAELRFRPVLGVLPPEGESEATTTTSVPGEATTTSVPADAAATSVPAEETTTTVAADPAATTTSEVPTTTTTVPPGTTSREDDLPDQPVVLPELDRDGNLVARYQLGPSELTGKAVRTARAQAPQGLSGAWSVLAIFTSDGGKQFGDLTTKYVNQQLAIVLDGVVKSAPRINEAITGGEATITGQFTEREAKDLALVLRFGALPVQLEPQEIRQVSASLGRDSLVAGITAGVAGLVLVLLYMILYYRALGLVVILGLVVWSTLQWVVISYLGASYGLALSLAGAVGIIVSVGVTVDSYVVYFERLKDEIRSGRTVRSSVDRGFSAAFRTIRTADISSLIGAGLLYFLTVGPVRGFAFFLGLSTVLDLVVAWFFTRPLVALLGRNRVFTEAPWLGVARGLAAPSGAAP